MVNYPFSTDLFIHFYFLFVYFSHAILPSIALSIGNRRLMGDPFVVGKQVKCRLDCVVLMVSKRRVLLLLAVVMMVMVFGVVVAIVLGFLIVIASAGEFVVVVIVVAGANMGDNGGGGGSNSHNGDEWLGFQWLQVVMVFTGG